MLSFKRAQYNILRVMRSGLKKTYKERKEISESGNNTDMSKIEHKTPTSNYADAPISALLGVSYTAVSREQRYFIYMNYLRRLEWRSNCA